MQIATPIENRNNELRKELESIANRRGGLNPSTLLHVAKNPKSCLHDYFDWDDTEAARKWREAQAYDLIRRVKVTLEPSEGKSITVRAFWPIKQLDADGTMSQQRGSYIPICDVLNDEEATRQMIENAKRELKSFSIKFRQLSRVTDLEMVFQAIDDL
jgi:hypothetical protein